MRRGLLIVAGALIGLFPGVVEAKKETIGLSLLVQDGASEGVTIIRGNDLRFVEELDFVTVAETDTDQGIDPIIQSGDFSQLDWSGVELADEEWRPDGFGGFTRQRFYRNAAWMEQAGVFIIFQVDDKGKLLPVLPHVVNTGRDDFWSPLDGGFIRRFTARQVTSGCAAVDNCDDAVSHVAQGLVQLRNPQLPAIIDSRRIHKKTASLVVMWSADPSNLRTIPVSQIEKQDTDFTYGFDLDLEVVTPPANGQYYLPGDAITFRAVFTDGDGNPFDDEDGFLPTFAEFIFGGTESGLRYFDLLLNPTLYYALKHREGNITVALGGPTNGFSVTDYTVPFDAFFAEQIQVAFAEQHGFSAVSAGIPSYPVLLGGLFDPSVWNAPVPAEITMTVPEDALPGTYLVTTKARRDFGGEAVNKGVVRRIQVGTPEVTAWEPTTKNCNTCHTGSSALSNILHGIGDRESCLAGCHTSLEVEPDAAIDYRVHFVHTRSNRYAADPDDCLVCHVEQPEGIPRGYPGFVFPFE